MKVNRFEHKITILYTLIGGLWILFSDKILYSLIIDKAKLSDYQTYKGWFYVIITAIMLFFFIRRHLKKQRDSKIVLREHQNQLEDLVKVRTELLELNIKRLKETQAHLVQTEKMASLGILTAGVAHEINNPLNYIMGSYVGLLRHYKENTFSDYPEQVGKLIEAMKTGIDRSSAIVQGLNQFSRKSDSYDEDCNVNEIVENSLIMLHNLIKSQISIEKDYNDSDIIIKGNVGNLHQVFINILGNAIQAIKSEKGTISIKTEEKESEVLITIADTGVGIPKKDLKKVTDPFFTTKAPGEGTGLGLSITYNIINEHKGKLEFESEVGKGTTVRIVLPK
ncbi:GHKL domain-containing protein [Psychroflexus sp. CAK1W]|uniref:sensor histidine kinase n=1 Tax=Psychroflexus curvus TaxID=2873595 RepID=UPI001CCEDFE0|nr:ATP-binding protein [Psychroflexus curvus]MBZ9628837.1 GHKL domain-containing protein [Psychroflexus curvus]